MDGKSKNVFITLAAVIIFALLWIAMYPVMDAWAAREAKRYTVICDPGYELEFLENGGLKVIGACKGVEPLTKPDTQPDNAYPEPAYPEPDNRVCDGLWMYGQDCNP